MPALALALALVSSLALGGHGFAAAETTVDEEAAASFVEDTFWLDRGTAVDFPGHVVFPTDSKRVLDVLADTGGGDQVAPRAAAEAAAALQQPNGGFLPFAAAPLGPGVQATGAAVALATEQAVPFDEAAAETYLETSQNVDGGFGGAATWNGLPGSFVIPTYYAVLGLDALDALDSETRIEVRAFLLAGQNPDGGWANWRWGHTSSTTPTYFAVRTLSLLDALDPVTKTKVAGFLELVEAPVDGGFHESYEPPTCYFCTDEPPSVPATGRALLTHELIRPADAATKLQAKLHAAWLAERQVDEGPLEGGFPLFGDASQLLVHRAYEASEEWAGDNPVPRPFGRTEPAVTDWSRNTALAIAGLEAHGQLDVVDLPEARSFLAASQHEGTGGFGSLPGYLEKLDATAAAYRALDRLERTSSAPTDALATTLGDQQEEDGSIPEPRWDLAPRLTHTADAIEALNRTGRLDAVDADAAAEYIASWQGQDGGFDGPEPWSDIQTAWKAVRALDTLGELDRIDRDALAGYLAGYESEEGKITWVDATDPAAAWDTARALRTLETIDRLDAVDVDAAVEYLASWQNEDGTFARSSYRVPTAAHVVLALSDVDRLDAIDANATRSKLVTEQRDHGGFADPGFPPGPNPMVRHALALDALHELGAI